MIRLMRGVGKKKREGKSLHPNLAIIFSATIRPRKLKVRLVVTTKEKVK